MIDPLVEFLVTKGASDREHSGSEFLSHLEGTRTILERWGMRSAVCTAGLFHSLYGTLGVPGLTALTERPAITELIGPEAEALVYLFCGMVKTTLLRNLDHHDSYYLHNRFTGTWIFIQEQQVHDLCHLTAANWLEQAPRMPRELMTATSGEIARITKRLEPEACQELADFGCRDSGFIAVTFA